MQNHFQLVSLVFLYIFSSQLCFASSNQRNLSIHLYLSRLRDAQRYAKKVHKVETDRMLSQLDCLTQQLDFSATSTSDPASFLVTHYLCGSPIDHIDRAYFNRMKIRLRAFIQHARDILTSTLLSPNQRANLQRWFDLSESIECTFCTQRWYEFLHAARSHSKLFKKICKTLLSVFMCCIGGGLLIYFFSHKYRIKNLVGQLESVTNEYQNNMQIMLKSYQELCQGVEKLSEELTQSKKELASAKSGFEQDIQSASVHIEKIEAERNDYSAKLVTLVDSYKSQTIAYQKAQQSLLNAEIKLNSLENEKRLACQRQVLDQQHIIKLEKKTKEDQQKVQSYNYYFKSAKQADHMISEIKEKQSCELSGLALSWIPSVLFSYQHLLVLKMDNCSLRVLDSRIGNLINLVILSLANNRLTALPKSLRKATKMASIDISGNFFRRFPEVVCNFKYLVKMVIKHNPIVLERSITEKTRKENPDIFSKLTIISPQEEKRIAKKLPIAKIQWGCIKS